MIISLPPIFLIWQVRLREGEWLALGHTARKRQSCNVNPGLPVVVARSGVIAGLGGRHWGSSPRAERGSGVWYSQKAGGRETPVTRGRVCLSPEPAWMRAWPLFVRPRIAQSQNGPPRPLIFGRIRPAKTAAPCVAHSGRSCPAL